jgi:hypothetical protein
MGCKMKRERYEVSHTTREQEEREGEGEATRIYIYYYSEPIFMVTAANSQQG